MRQPTFPMHYAKRAQPAAALAAIIALAILIRAPFNLNAGVDEAFYLVVARQWLEGVPPYAGSFDVKPPLLFLLMAGSEALFGPTLLAAKALTTAAAAIAACGLYLFGRHFIGALAGVTAAIFYILSTLTLGGTFSPAELLMAPFTAFGMLAGLAALLDCRRARFRTLFASGFLFGAAACIKQTAIFTAAPLALGLLFGGRCTSRLKAFASFAAGFCVVPIAFATYFLAIGHLGDLINDAAITALLRAGTGYVPWHKAFGLLMAGMLTVLPIILMAGVFWAERRPLRAHPAYPSILFLAAWTGSASLGVLLTKGMFFIYTLPVLQPLCLAAGGFVQHVLGRIESRERRWLARTGILASAILYSCYAASPLFLAGGNNVKAAEAAAALMLREGKRPGDRILVVDRDLLVYVTAGTEPPVPIFHPLHLLCRFPLKGAEAALADSMRSKPAFVVLGDPPVAVQCEEPSRREAIAERLARDYCEVGHFESSVTGWPGSFAVFKLKERASPAAPDRCAKRSISSALQRTEP
ncbi:MAG: glycosyltransferase family 39 protein [Rhodomicrobium sp.]